MAKPVVDVTEKRSLESSYSAKLMVNRVIRTIVCIFLCLLSLFPFYIMIINATRDSDSIKTGLSLIPSSNFMANIDTLMKKAEGVGAPFWRALLNSFIVAAPTTLLAVYFPTMTAYGIHAYSFKLRKFAWGFIMAIMMVPSQVSIVGFYQFLLKIDLIDSYIPLIVPAVAAPSVVFFMRQYMQSSLPLEVIEAARIDGASEFRTFNTIVLPLMKPAIATQAIFQFIASWNNLFTPTILINTTSKSTLPMFIQILRSEQFRTDYGMVYMGLFLTIIPIFVVYFILSKYIIAGVALGGVKE